MFKRINVPGIIILVAALLAVQLAVGLVLSPMVTPLVVDNLNKATGAKVTIDKAALWPVTLSLSVDGLKVFDPDDPGKRMVEVKKASFRLGLWALLSKRIAFSYVRFDGVDLNLEGEPDGSFNVQKLARPAGEEKPGGIGALWQRVRGGKDWFSRVYDMIKKGSSRETREKESETKKEARKITKEVEQLPKGRVVKFKTARDYLFRINELSLTNARVHLKADGGRSADVDNANIKARGIAIDPEKAAKVASLSLKGRLSEKGQSAGDFQLSMSTSYSGGKKRIDIDAWTRDIDLAAISFIYDDSLPVNVVKGKLDINSKTSIVGETLDSRNSLVLKGQELAVKGGSQASVSFMPMPALVDAMNQVDPLKLKFDITGTVDNPQFSGFQDALQELMKPYIENLGKNLEKQGMNAIQKFFKKEEGTPQDAASSGEDQSAQKTIDSIKALFSGAKEESK